MKLTEYIVIKEGIIGGVLNDVFTFGGTILLFLFNHKVLGGTWYIDLLFAVIALSLLPYKSTAQRFYSVQDAMNYLKSKFIQK